MKKDSDKGFARAVSFAVFAAALVAGAMSSPVASAADAQACEGDDAVFTIATGVPPSDWWSYRWSYATASGSATKGTDFASVSGKLVFNSGESTKSVSVATYKDTLNEGNEDFDLKFSDFETKGLLSGTSGWVSTDPAQFYGMPSAQFDMDGEIVNRDSITGNCG